MKKKEKIIKKRKSLYVALLSFLITAGVMVYIFVQIGVWPFGDRTILIADSTHQYLPFFSSLWKKLDSGESFFWSIKGGFGFNYWTTYAYYLASPTNLLMKFIPWRNVCDYMDWSILIKIAMCSGAFGWYASKRDEENGILPSVMVGMAYGLGAYILGYYYNIMWLDSIFAAPLIMYGIEKIVKDRKFGFYLISLAYGIWCNYYIGFMLCLFSILWFIVCEISCSKKEGYFKDLFCFGLSSLSAGGICSVILIPAYKGLGAVESATHKSIPSWRESYMGISEIIERHLMLTEPVSVAETQNGLNIYCGVFVLVFFFLYLSDHKIRFRERVSKLCLVLMLLLSFTSGKINYIWHGFYVQHGIPNRHSFLYIALMLTLVTDVFPHIKEIPAWKKIVSIAIPAGFILVRLNMAGGNVKPYYVSLVAIIGYAAVIMAISEKRASYAHILKSGICIFACCEIVLNAVGIWAGASGVSRSFYIDDAEAWQKMVSQYGDEGFYRSEIDRQHMRNASLYAGGNSIVMFNSTMDARVTKFCKAIGMESRLNKNGYYGTTKLMDDVFGIKYVASPARKGDSFHWMQMISGYGPMDLFENKEALSIGFVVNDEILDWNPYNKKNPFEVQNEFVYACTGLKEPLFTYEGTLVSDSNESEMHINLKSDRQTYIFPQNQMKVFELHTPELDRIVDNYGSNIWGLGSPADSIANGSKKASFCAEGFNGWNVYIDKWSCSNALYKNVNDILRERQLTDIAADGNGIKGFLPKGRKGVLLLTVFCGDGMTAFIDGKETEIKKIGDMFVGIEVDGNEHYLELKFTPPGLRTGMILSLLSLAVIAMWNTIVRYTCDNTKK